MFRLASKLEGSTDMLPDGPIETVRLRLDLGMFLFSEGAHYETMGYDSLVHS